MLNTVKKRLVFLTSALLLVFSVIIIFVAYQALQINKYNRLVLTNTRVLYIAEKISNDYEVHNGIAKELAVIASVFYLSKQQNKDILNSTIKNNYQKELPKSGVGIWYGEYTINPDRKWFCTFAYKDSNDNIAFNNALENENYNYTHKPWFTTLQNQVLKGSKNIYTPTVCSATGKNSYVLTIGAGIYADKKFIGITTVDWELDALKDELSSYKPTKNSYILLADKENDFIIAKTNADKNIISHSLKTLPWYSEKLKSNDFIKDNNKSYLTFPKILDNGLLLVVNVPENELFGDLYARFTTITVLMILVIVLLVLVTQYVLTKNVNKPIQYLINIAQKIGNGDLNAIMDIKNPEEFAQLADAFNKMTTDIKEYVTNLNEITAQKNRIEMELSIARSIQASSLPTVFPPYPDRCEFDVYASMEAAKEVGGDFYDFFFVDKDNFVFLIADVSGKGVPAALFMMQAKTLLRNIIKTGLPLDEAINKVNRKICKNNKYNYFITAFIVKVNLLNGNTSFVNAGHNPSLIKRQGMDYSYLEIDNNIVLGAFNDFSYKKVEDKLSAGDKMFLYTDGVTEAMNSNQELYGEQKLRDILNINKDYELKDVVNAVKQDIKTYAGEEEQSDDITVITFKYNGLS